MQAISVSSVALGTPQDPLFLVRLSLSVPKRPLPSAPVGTHHVYVFDVSGSMDFDLPKVRKVAKEKFAQLREGDAVSCIWFSGRGETGILIDRQELPTLRDLKKLSDTVDRWLKPVGLTGFKEPLALAREVIAKDKRPASLFFMSDGMDNQWSQADVLAEARALRGKVASATFVEYGYYAGRQLLAKMAEETGGKLVFAEQFKDFEPALQASLEGRAVGEPLKTVLLGARPECGLVFAIGESEKEGIVTYGALHEQVEVPERMYELFYLAKSEPIHTRSEGESRRMDFDRAVPALYAALSVYATRMRPDLVFPVLRALGGDVRFVREYQGLFGKQAYTRFQEAARMAVWDDKERGKEGMDPRAVPKDDAATVLDVLDVLSADEETRILFEHPAFSFTPISRGRQEVPPDGAEALKFVADPAQGGYPLQGLTYNEDRANISILLKKPGTVDVSKRIPFKDKLPGAEDGIVKTHQWRNYPIVADGLVNIQKLPVSVSLDTFKKLERMDVPFTKGSAIGGVEHVEVTLHLGSMPVLNRQRVAAPTAKGLLEEAYVLLGARCRQKVMNSVAKALLGSEKKVDQQAAAEYGPEVAKWLTSQGITAGGFQPPKTKQKEAKDYYTAYLLTIDIKGGKTLPSVEDAEKGKGALAGALMRIVIDDCKKREAAATGKAGKAAYAKWVEAEQKAAVADVRAKIVSIAQKKFALLVAGIWFSEFAATPGAGELSLIIDENDVKGTFKLEEEKVFV